MDGIYKFSICLGDGSGFGWVRWGCCGFYILDSCCHGLKVLFYLTRVVAGLLNIQQNTTLDSQELTRAEKKFFKYP